jgi:hypothetical protein
MPSNGGRRVSARSAIATALLFAGALLAPACGYSTAAEEEGGAPASVEAVDGSEQARVVLTPDAARRIGLETTPVVPGAADRTIVLAGTVAGGGANPLTVRVTLPGDAAAGVDPAEPARILTPGGRRDLVAPPARPGSAAPAGGSREYRLDGAGGSVRAGDRLRVELALRGAGRRSTVPYSAVIYWIDGGTWVYVRTAPLTFRRAPVDIEVVDGDVAVLRRGPPAGTPVVSVGGEELLGTEFEIEGE